MKISLAWSHLWLVIGLCALALVRDQTWSALYQNSHAERERNQSTIQNLNAAFALTSLVNQTTNHALMFENQDPSEDEIFLELTKNFMPALRQGLSEARLDLNTEKILVEKGLELQAALDDTLASLLFARETADSSLLKESQANLLEKKSIFLSELQGIFDTSVIQSPIEPPPSTWFNRLLLGISIAYALLIILLTDRDQRLLKRTSTQGAVSKPTYIKELADPHRLLNHAQTEIQSLKKDQAERQRVHQQRSTHTRRIEQHLAELKVYNANLINSLSSAVFTTDNTGTITRQNRSALLFQIADGASIWESSLGQALKTVKPNAESILDAQDSVSVEALSYSNADGQQQYFDLRIVPLKDESGQRRGFIWVADDVTESENTKHLLFQSEQLAATGRLSAQVAHEIRNPLSALMLNAELLNEELLQNQMEAKDLTKSIIHELERLSQITDTYLELARTPKHQAVNVDIHEIITDLMAFLGPDIRRYGHAYTFALNAQNSLLNADPGQIRQALLNIVTNARDAMHKAGTIFIHTASTDHELMVDIKDTGPEVPKENLDRAFEPFFSTKTNGTGLGLSLTKDMIHKAGGSIAIWRSEDQHTVVRITLPT